MKGRWSEEDLEDLAEEAGEIMAYLPDALRREWATTTFGEDLGPGEERAASWAEQRGPGGRTVWYDPDRRQVRVAT